MLTLKSIAGMLAVVETDGTKKGKRGRKTPTERVVGLIGPKGLVSILDKPQKMVAVSRAQNSQGSTPAPPTTVRSNVQVISPDEVRIGKEKKRKGKNK
jgi:hypothetical protein